MSVLITWSWWCLIGFPTAVINFPFVIKTCLVQSYFETVLFLLRLCPPMLAVMVDLGCGNFNCGILTVMFFFLCSFYIYSLEFCKEELSLLSHVFIWLCQSELGYLLFGLSRNSVISRIAFFLLLALIFGQKTFFKNFLDWKFLNLPKSTGPGWYGSVDWTPACESKGWPANQRIAGSVHSQGTCLGCGPGSQ